MRSNRGFTLIELMIVVAVVAILAAIAYPAYTEQVRKGKRAEARSSMSQIQLLQERWRAERPSYATQDDFKANYAAVLTSENGNWTFEIKDVTGSAYTIEASVAGNHKDPLCASGFSLEVSGINVTKKPAACWQ